MCNNYCVSLILEKFAIKKLNLSKTKIGNEGLKNICKTLLGIYNEENNINENNNLYYLEALNLFNIDIKNEDGLEFLGKVVSHEKCKIETLILSKNKITQFFFDEKNNNNKKKMKNISCIETLSVQELSKLSELDLHDLSEKISETHNWIKQLLVLI